jgi:hypothetical protein
MQDQTEATPWHIVRNQITGLRVFENQIEDLRTLLAEDWKMRLCQREAVSGKAMVYRGSSGATRCDHVSNPAFSAC